MHAPRSHGHVADAGAETSERSEVAHTARHEQRRAARLVRDRERHRDVLAVAHGVDEVAQAAEPRGRVRNEVLDVDERCLCEHDVQPAAPANRGAEPVPGASAPRRGRADARKPADDRVARARTPELERGLDVGARDADVVVDVERRLGAEAIGPEAVVQTV